MMPQTTKGSAVTTVVAATRAYAKINLSLEVLGRRADGYHEVRTILQTVSLCDELTVALATTAGISIAGEEAAGVPDGSENLAARALAAYVRTRPPWHDGPALMIQLDKSIPPAGGLGGGSSDAAAALRAADFLQSSPAGPGALESIASEIGSDVAFFLRGGTQLASGRGEQLVALPDAADVALVLLCPNLPLAAKTARLYGALNQQHFSDGSRTELLADRIRAGKPHDAQDYLNSFDDIAESAFDGIAAFRQALVSECGHAILCGAGPSLFALVHDQNSAQRAARRLRDRGLRAFAVTTVGASQSSQVTRRMNNISPVDILQ